MEKTASEIVTLKRNIRLQEWNRQIEEQKSSGLSVQEWCQQHGIKPKTYYYHLRKVREGILHEPLFCGKQRKGRGALQQEVRMGKR